jgi:polyhydroxyalkanoate synthesis regulator phasin
MAEDNYRTDIELMKRDIGLISKLVEKIDVTIDKLQQVATDIGRIVALQEQKIMSQEKVNDEVDRLLERQALAHATEVKELHGKIDGVIEKINSLEKWRYAAMAIISCVVFVVGNISGLAKLFLP